MQITPRGDRSGALAAFAIQQGPHTGEEIPVRSPVARIGRSEENEIVLGDDSVSARHARLEFDEGAWRLTDLDSTNGTYVEGVRLAPSVPTPLHYGASVRFGGIALHFRPVEEADPAAARAEYVAPEAAPPKIRERRRRGLPLWLAVAILVLVVIGFFLFTTYNPAVTRVEEPADEPPPVVEQPAPEAAPPAAPATP